MTSLITNPIFQRELLDRLRSQKTLGAILTIAIGSSFMVMMRWPSEAAVDSMSQGSMQVFRPLAWGMAAAITMLVPAFPATAFVTERRRGTLALLLNSPISAMEIYWGKLFGNVLLSMILLSVSLPALMACFAMGGISLRSHIGPLVLVFFAMSVQYSAVGLWISIQSQSADASLRATYATVLGLSVLSVAPTVLAGNLTGIYSLIAHWMTAISPMSALQEITGSQAQADAIGISTGWPAFLVASIGTTVLLAAATLTKLNPLLLDRPRPVGRVLDAKNSGGWLRRITYLVDPEKRKLGIPWWLNPVMVKEFRTRKFGRLHWLIRLIFFSAVVSLLLTVVAATGTVRWGVERIAAAMVLLQVCLLLLLGPSLGANLIASEVESGGWQLLRASPIPTWRILIGKLMSAVWTLLLLLCATLPGYLVMSSIQPAISGQVSNVVISLIVLIFMVTSVSACLSAFSRTTAMATTTSYAALLILFAGTLLIWLARGKPFGPLLVERALLFNPTAAALAEMKTPGFAQYQLTPQSWYVGIALSLSCLLVLALRTWRMTRPD